MSHYFLLDGATGRISKIREISAWCKNAFSDGSWELQEIKYSVNMFINIKNDEDATLFRLRWM